MSKINRGTIIPIQKRSRKKNNDFKQSNDIFKLIDLIPKQEKGFLPFKKESANQNFASSLLVYCEQRFPKKLEALIFSESDTLGNLIYQLTEIVYSQKETISYIEDAFENGESDMIDFIKEEIDYEWCWYLMEGKYYLKIQSKELRTAFFKVLSKFSKQIHTSFLDHNFKDLDDSHFGEMCDFLEEQYEENLNNESDEIDTQETFQEYYERMVEPIKNCITEYQIHKNLDIDNKIFKNYIPKNEYEKNLKDLLRKGLNDIDFQIFQKFAENINPYYADDGAISFKESFMLLYDLSENSVFENELFENFNMRSDNEEVTYPSKYYRVSGDIITKGISRKDTIELKKLCNYLCEFAKFFDV